MIPNDESKVLDFFTVHPKVKKTTDTTITAMTKTVIVALRGDQVDINWFASQ